MAISDDDLEVMAMVPSLSFKAKAVFLSALGVGLVVATATPVRAQTLRTLRRKLDHVVITGKDLRKQLNNKISKMRLVAFNQGKMEVIPFQIDERTPSGSYAFDKGSETKKDTDQGRFDLNDELVFMARDSGDQAKAGSFTGLKNVLEIELTDPKKNRKGWVYLVHYPKNAPPLSKADYTSIKLDKKGHLTWTGRGFQTDNNRSTGNAVRTSGVMFETKKGGKLGSNVLDTTKTRCKLYYWAIPISRNGTEMRTAVGAYIDGPVRAVAMNVVEIYLVWGFWVKAPNSLIKFYDYGSEMPSNVNMPINVDKSPESYARLSLDLSPRVRSWFFYNNNNKTPVKIDGVMSPAEKALKTAFPDWNVVYGNEGGMISRFIFADKTIAKKKYSRLHYVDDLREKDPPENEQGCYGNIGFNIDLSGMSSGIYQGTYYTYYQPRFRYGDEQRYLDIVDKPLKFAVKLMK